MAEERHGNGMLCVNRPLYDANKEGGPQMQAKKAYAVWS